MKHLSPVEISEFVYGEGSPEKQSEMASHIESCAQCRDQANAWNATRAQLRSWKLAPDVRDRAKPARQFGGASILKWAAAAMLMAGLGFALARWTSAYDTGRVRAQMSAEITEQVSQRLKLELARINADQSARQKEYQEAITKAIGRIEAQRLVELANLRQDVETVAVNAQDQLEQTRKGLHALAASEGPSREPVKH